MTRSIVMLSMFLFEDGFWSAGVNGDLELSSLSKLTVKLLSEPAIVKHQAIGIDRPIVFAIWSCIQTLQMLAAHLRHIRASWYHEDYKKHAGILWAALMLVHDTFAS